MRFRVQMCVPVVAIALLFGLAGVAARAQDKQHVVSLSDLNKDAARPALLQLLLEIVPVSVEGEHAKARIFEIAFHVGGINPTGFS